MHYVIFDLEFNQAYRCPTNDLIKQEIVEIGAVKVDENLSVIDSFQSYIRPKLFRRLNPYMQEKTNLTIEKLNSEGKPFGDIIKQFIKWLGEDFILCSWALDDIRELRNNCAFYKVDTGWINKFLDLQRIYTVLNELPNKVSLHKAVDTLNIELDSDFHSAINDAFYTLEIFKKIFDKDRFASIAFDKLEFKVVLDFNQKKEFYENHKYKVNCPECGRFTKKLHKKMRNSSLIATHFCGKCKIKVRYKATPIKENNDVVIKSQIKRIKTEE